jgi:inhibitor of KinA
LVIPERSVGIAGLQTGIYPSESPGGWNIVGNTPLPIVTGQNSTPFLLHSGDEVKFQAITKNDYEHIEGEIREGTFNWDTIYG